MTMETGLRGLTTRRIKERREHVAVENASRDLALVIDPTFDVQPGRHDDDEVWTKAR